MRTLLLILALVAVPVQAVTLRWAAQNDILTLDPHSQNHATTHAMITPAMPPDATDRIRRMSTAVSPTSVGAN